MGGGYLFSNPSLSFTQRSTKRFLHDYAKWSFLELITTRYDKYKKMWFYFSISNIGTSNFGSRWSPMSTEVSLFQVVEVPTNGYTCPSKSLSEWAFIGKSKNLRPKIDCIVCSIFDKIRIVKECMHAISPLFSKNLLNRPHSRNTEIFRDEALGQGDRRRKAKEPR